MIDISALKKRVISAAILIPVTLIVVLIGGVLFNIFAAAIVVLLVSEYAMMLHKINKSELLKKSLPYLLAYTALPAAALVSLRNLDSGVEVIIYLLSIVWITDTVAYFAGKNFGGPKLAPKISPNKTISGAVGGALGAAVFGVFAYFLTSDAVTFYGFIMLSIFFSIISQIGDLLESYIKRRFEVKDSGDLIPGHGGLFDRLDGLLLVVVFGYLVFGILNQNIF